MSQVRDMTLLDRQRELQCLITDLKKEITELQIINELQERELSITRYGMAMKRVSELEAVNKDNHDRAEAIILAREQQNHRMHDEMKDLQFKLSRYEQGVRLEDLKVLRKWIGADTQVGTVCMGADVPKEWIGEKVTVVIMKGEDNAGV